MGSPEVEEEMPEAKFGRHSWFVECKAKDTGEFRFLDRTDATNASTSRLYLGPIAYQGHVFGNSIRLYSHRDFPDRQADVCPWKRRMR